MRHTAKLAATAFLATTFPMASVHSFHDLIASLQDGSGLSPDEISFAAAFLLDPSAELASKSDFLRALSRKGETDAEIAGFVEAFLQRAVDPSLDPASLSGPMIDCCGTGGDKLDLFNVSTTSLFVLAAGGAVVVKHGNRSVTSQCGGADVLEALGVQINLPPAGLRRCVESTGCGFLFAPHYHPAFKEIGPVRKALGAEGVTTIFNLLGPLLNPARPSYQLVGIFSAAALSKYAGVLHRLGRRRAWTIHGRSSNGGGMDELSTMGETEVHAVDAGAIVPPWTLAHETVASLGIPRARLEDLRGGNREENARIVAGILDGSLTGPKRDLVVLNAAAGFVVAGLSPDLASGVAHANEQIASGRAFAKLKALRAFAAENSGNG